MVGGTRITENAGRSGQRVVGDAVEHDRARVEHGPSGVGGEQVSGPLDDLGVAGAERRLEHALQRQQPVHVAGQLRGLPMLESLRIGNVVGAFATTVVGDVEGLPSWREVQEMRLDLDVAR